MNKLVEQWLAEHGDVLWRFARARTRSRDAAEDVVQETILAAMRAHHTFSGASCERTWLLGIAAHKAADHFRAVRRRAGRSADAGEVAEPVFSEQGLWARPPAAWGIGPGDGAEHAEALAALRRCIDQLPPSQSEAVWMRDLLGIPAAEVCKSLGLTPTNLWTRLHRARAALRQCVERSVRGTKGGTG
jgi:RNA polymerase sigma-70 factor (ECF subfamily)